MKPTISFFGLPIGISATVWLIVGLTRRVHEKFFQRYKRVSKRSRLTKKDIAVILPAHNEELVLQKCISALKKSLSVKQIYVISDGSTDKTYAIARRNRCNVLQTPGLGKAKAMVYGIKKFQLFKKNKLIFIVDADTRIDVKFVSLALRMLRDPDIGVVFGTARIIWPKHVFPRLGLYYVAYRERLNRMLTLFFSYGQTWKYTNTNYVIPGFATIYRSRVLKQLKIDTPGLLVEDFNLAFQLHKKKIAKIGFHPSLIGWDQHPDNLIDYWKQVRRWNIAFFQTVRANRFWPSMFWLALIIFTVEVFLNSVFILFIPVLLLYLLAPLFSPIFPFMNSFANFYKNFGPFSYVSIFDIFFAVFLYDYVVTIIFGIVGKKPQFAIYGLFFFFMHYVTSLILLSSIIPGFFGSSNGRWISPTRRSE